MLRLRRAVALLLSAALAQVMLLGGGAVCARAEAAQVAQVAHAGHESHGTHASRGTPDAPGRHGATPHDSLPCAAAGMPCAVAALAVGREMGERTAPRVHRAPPARDDRTPTHDAAAPEPPPPRA